MDPEMPAFAHRAVQAKTDRSKTGLDVELLIPARAMPRFPAKDPLVLDLCITFEEREDAGAAPTSSSNCKAGSMPGEAPKLSPEQMAFAQITKGIHW